jgi:adenylate kinase
MGPPGAGKGTQAIRLAQDRGYAHISTGEMLRQAVASGSELGKQVAPIIEAGEYVTDDLMGKLIQERIAQPDCASGFILDGFPRTVVQAELLSELFKDTPLSGVVLFTVSSAAVRARLENRRGAEERADDSVEVQMRRLEVYQEKTAPLIDYYRRQGSIIEVDGDGSIDEVYERLLKAV